MSRAFIFKDEEARMNQEDKYCITFKMSEMREFLEMINPYLDDNARMKVTAFLYNLRQKRAEEL